MSTAPRAPITTDEVRRAGVELTRCFLHGYYASWRLAEVLTIKKLVEQRHTFYADIAADIGQHDDRDGSATIAQEIHHGLYFDAIAHCVQYVEDLFALIRASRRPQAFIRSVITYKAGEITNEIRTFTTDRKRIGQAFHFPQDLTLPTPDGRKAYEHGITNLTNWTADLVRFFKDYEFFYNQYKHGLKVAMRPFNKYTPEQVEQDRLNPRRPYLAVYDNLNLKDATKKGTANLGHGIMIPCFGENVRRALPQLERRNEWLRLLHPKDPSFSFDMLVDHAFKARSCIDTFCSNFSRAVDPDPKEIVFCLPVDHRTRNTYQCRVPSGEV